MTQCIATAPTYLSSIQTALRDAAVMYYSLSLNILLLITAFKQHPGIQRALEQFELVCIWWSRWEIALQGKPSNSSLISMHPLITCTYSLFTSHRLWIIQRLHFHMRTARKDTGNACSLPLPLLPLICLLLHHCRSETASAKTGEITRLRSVCMFYPPGGRMEKQRLGWCCWQTHH